MHDLIILGGGPAGLTATMYAIQKRLDVLLITRDLGGKTNYQLKLPFMERHMVINGNEILSRFANEIKYLDFVHLIDSVERIEAIKDGYIVTTTGQQKIETRALIIATGAKGELLDVPGEHEFMMRGLCYSAISYAQLLIDRRVVVIGDGALALRGVAELARSAQHVTLIAAMPNEFDTALAQRLRSMPHVEFLEGYAVKEIRGDQYARSIVVAGREGTREIFADAFFVEKDLIPRSHLVAHLVDTDAKGHIKINAKNETSATGIYAAGDVTNTYSEQVLISIGEGAKASLTAYNYLIQQNLLSQQVPAELSPIS
jgi:NADH-dependent peroxiredoxin subunit F